jgi:hypothetical protein
MSLLGAIAAWIGRHLFLVLVLAFGLVVAKGVVKEIQLLVDQQKVQAGAESVISSERSRYHELAQDITKVVADAKGWPAQQLTTKVADSEKQLGNLVAERERSCTPIAIIRFGLRPCVAAEGKRHLVEAQVTFLRSLIAHRSPVEQLEKLRLAHMQAYEALKAKEAQLAALKARSPIGYRVPGTDTHRQAGGLAQEIANLRAANGAASDAYARQREVVVRRSLPPDFRAPGFEQVAQRARQYVDGARGEVNSWLLRLYEDIWGTLPAAAAILLSIVALPFAGRLVLFSVVARWASARPAVRLLQGVGGLVTASTDGSASAPDPARRTEAVSAKALSLKLESGQELVVRSALLGSPPGTAVVSTQLVLDWRRFFSCAAAKLLFLTRVRNTGGEAVVLRGVEPHDELSCLNVPVGAAVVIHARALSGVIRAQGSPFRISSIWRLTESQAWLTLRLRSLVVQGPVTLVVWGRGGVKAESAGTGRSVHELCTIAFSANLRWGVRRREPMLLYVFGGQSLFDDKFSQEDGAGFVVFSAHPTEAGEGRTVERFFGRIFDGVLRVFGI